MSAAFTNSEFGKPPNEIEDLLGRLPAKLLIAYWVRDVHGKPDDELFKLHVERVLRESVTWDNQEYPKCLATTEY